MSETTAQLKESQAAHGTEILTEVLEWTGTALLGLAMRLSSQASPFNLVVTNVPGPPVPLYLLGARMLEAYPLVPLFMGQALGIARSDANDGSAVVPNEHDPELDRQLPLGAGAGD